MPRPVTSAPVTVLTGPARSGKTHRMVQEYREALGRAPVGQALWLSPTSRSAGTIREQILAANLSAVLDPGIVTFETLADRVLAALPDAPRRLSSVAERELLRQVVDRALTSKSLAVFADAARHASFIDLLKEHFGELKRHGIAPATFAKSSGLRGDRTQHEELSNLYTDYEHLLETHQLTDAEGRHLAVRDALAAAAWPPAVNLKLVVADGFTDFTHTQHEILVQLAATSKRLCITLPGEELSPPSTSSRKAGRTDLFAKSAAALAELKRHHPRLHVEVLPPRPTTWPALDHLAHNIFRPPRDVTAPSSEAIASLHEIEIIAAAGAQDEVIQIAHRIKERLVAGATRPGDFAVVFRSLHDAAPRVREVFDEFGIPYSLEVGRPLASSGTLRVLLDLLRLDRENWPFRQLVAIVSNNLLSIFDRPIRAATEWLIRDLQVAEGREPLLRRVEQLAEQSPPDSTDHRSHRASAAALALQILRPLADAIDELPKAAPPTEWITAFEQLGTRLGIGWLGMSLGEPPGAASVSEPPDSLHLDNRLAWQQIKASFSAVERLATDLGNRAPISRADAMHLLIDIAAHESLPRPYDDAGRVRVLSASTARSIEARHVFLAGMSEQAFPAPERLGSFYSEADYQAFQNVGDQRRAESPPPPVDRAHEEMLLFYEVLTRATERLTISYPGLDDKAQDLSPSSYVTELERLLDGHAAIRHATPQLSPLTGEQPPLSPTEWRVAALGRALAPNPDRDLTLLAGLISDRTTKHVAGSIDAALRVHALRSNRDDFGPADGLLTSPTIRARLARRFGSQHLWSPSQWEKFARCPFHSLMEDVLQLEPLGELTLETDAARRGSLVHRVLARVHRELQAGDGKRTTFSQRDPTTVAAAFERALAAELGVEPRPGLDGALEELDRRQIAKWSEQYVAQHGDYDDAWQNQIMDQSPLPTYFEFRFGPPRSEETDGEDPRSTAEPFLLDLGNEQIRITGRIDRIDVGQSGGQTVFNVIDYKSGKRPSLTVEKMESGERLQPPLYVMAAQVLLFGESKGRPLWAGYWSMDKGITTSAKYSLNCSAEEWESLQQNVVACIRQFVADIRAGNFPVSSRDEHCTSYCNFSTVCRIAQVRSLGKQWMPLTTDN
jgi:ATP-dependent helicase/nuclease subunit B